jgi:phytoene synthase
MSALDRGYAACAAVTREKAKSFYFAGRFLPAAKRRGVFALYDFCRHVDDLVDERGDRPAPEVRQELAALATLLRDGGAGRSARWDPLFDTLARRRVPIEPLLELIEGIEGDLDHREIQTEQELLRYCHQVAGVVGLALGPLLGARSTGFETAGAALGIAMQLTNVLRDVGADARLGRIYLPAAELARFGLTREDVLAGTVDDRWRAFMAFQIRRARGYYAEGERVVPLFPADGSRLTVLLMARTYAGILDAIERQGYDVFAGRAHVGPAGKLRILARTLASALTAAPSRARWGWR